MASPPSRELYTPVSAPPGSVQSGRFENEEWFSAPLPPVRPSSRPCGPLGRHLPGAADSRPLGLDGAVKQKKNARPDSPGALGESRRVRPAPRGPEDRSLQRERPLTARLDPLDVPPDRPRGAAQRLAAEVDRQQGQLSGLPSPGRTGRLRRARRPHPTLTAAAGPDCRRGGQAVAAVLPAAPPRPGCRGRWRRGPGRRSCRWCGCPGSSR